MRHITIICTARPSWARLEPVVNALNKRDDVTVRVEDGGFGIRNDESNLTQFACAVGAGQATSRFVERLYEEVPDAVLVHGDRYEVLGAAYAATILGIPLVHNQGGEVTGSVDEKIRHALTKLATLHFTATSRARENVVRMGEASENVHYTGCPSMDAALKYRGWPRKDYIIVLQHPVWDEYIDAGRQMQITLDAVKCIKVPVLFFGPNRDAGSTQMRDVMANAGIQVKDNVPADEFLELLANCACIVGNSSAGIREASFLGTPAVNIGMRQQYREFGSNVWHVPHDTDTIRNAIDLASAHGGKKPSDLYGDGHAAERIAHLLATAPLTTQKGLMYQ